MNIPYLVRKSLWGASGNKCAICKSDLVQDDQGGEKFNIGEECHIISEKPKGPRHKPEIKDYNTLENLILLCRNHHKEVDSLPDTYTEEILRYIKINHENWVKETLDAALKKNTPKPRFLRLITSGKELFEIVSDSYGYRTDYDEVKDEAEAEYIGGVLQSIIDYGEISGMVEAYDKVKMGFELGKLLDELALKGYFIYAENHIENIRFNDNKTSKWPIATFIIRRAKNEESSQSSNSES